MVTWMMVMSYDADDGDTGGDAACAWMMDLDNKPLPLTMFSFIKDLVINGILDTLTLLIKP